MTDADLMLACVTLMRSTRNSELLDVLAEVQARLIAKTLPCPAPKRDRPSRAAYMRAYRIKQRANPFQ